MKKKPNFIVSVSSIIFLFCFCIFWNLYPVEQKKLDNLMRLTLQFKEGKMTLLKVEPLEKIAPMSVKERILKEKDHPENYFFEIHDDIGNILARSGMKDPTMILMEYEDPEKPGRIVSKMVERKDVVFSILVPAPKNYHTIRFARIAPGQESIAVKKRRHEDLGTFKLRKDDSQGVK